MCVFVQSNCSHLVQNGRRQKILILLVLEMGRQRFGHIALIVEFGQFQHLLDDSVNDTAQIFVRCAGAIVALAQRQIYV